MTKTAQERLRDGALGNDIPMMQQAVKDGAKIDALYPETSFASGRAVRKNSTALYLALLGKQLDAAKWLIEQGANPNAVCESLSCPLHVACKEDDVEIVKKMIEKNPALNLDMDINGITPVDCAIGFGHVATLRVLLESGASPNRSDPPPLYALDSEDPNASDMTKLLLYHGANIHAKNSRDEPYHYQVETLTKSRIAQHRSELNDDLACAPGQGMPLQDLIGNGQPTWLFNAILGDNRLREIFSAQRWERMEAEAVTLRADIDLLTPEYYRSQLAIDMSALSEKALSKQEKKSAVDRYVRKPTGEVKR